MYDKLESTWNKTGHGLNQGAVTASAWRNKKNHKNLGIRIIGV
jgi:hypothetical protein